MLALPPEPYSGIQGVARWSNFWRNGKMNKVKGDWKTKQGNEKMGKGKFQRWPLTLIVIPKGWKVLSFSIHLDSRVSLTVISVFLAWSVDVHDEDIFCHVVGFVEMSGTFVTLVFGIPTVLKEIGLKVCLVSYTGIHTMLVERQWRWWLMVNCCPVLWRKSWLVAVWSTTEELWVYL